MYISKSLNPRGAFFIHQKVSTECTTFLVNKKKRMTGLQSFPSCSTFQIL